MAVIVSYSHGLLSKVQHLHQTQMDCARQCIADGFMALALSRHSGHPNHHEAHHEFHGIGPKLSHVGHG
jgi:hypothetical protein